MLQQLGHISAAVCKQLKLDIAPNTPIYVGEQNITHIKEKHPHDYEYYWHEVKNIISSPDYIGYSNKNNSIEYIKKVNLDPDTSILLAVRVSNSGKFFLRTFYNISEGSINSRLNKGTIIPV
ncbi:PBECR2 nuclease fold domain-containing protein [Veillonella magna]|uniref:Transposase n=1 Tax=Veillonella magna TaxID=464322 RepID=A0ABS2GIL5_9FIRM|nr:PBECR2 nuclease fold domain-containing protein [Veillonella magna]MBM6824828.1 transposase [Veillonella magna]MBM6913093.1 transposase [Veillonella magna]